MTNDFFNTFTLTGALLILLLIASLIAGVIEAFRRASLRRTDSDSRPKTGDPTEPAAAPIPTTNAPWITRTL